VKTSDKKRVIDMFVSKFNGTYKRLSPKDADYRIYDKDGEIIAYAEIRIIDKPMSKAYPLPMSARKIVKVCDKMLNPVVIWGCLDGIIYGNPTKISGVSSYIDNEIMLHYMKQKELKYYRYY